MRQMRFIGWCMLATSLALSACSASDEDDLRSWMAQERANAKPRIRPLEEPKPFTPQAYLGADGMDPFNPMKLMQVLRRESAQANANTSLIAAELNRRKEPLEAEPLDAMTMVGSLDKKGVPAALIKVGTLLYQVRVGNYLGQNYGKITRITETSIQLREIVQDGSGDWIERNSTLELQEGRK
ncbi:Pilus assembly protein, PilP [Delftia tsuruhatensis]|uniref:pilus assembly protein PilP n=1 Tax=Delftia tsuruhatensis TaxID=180282 RepID=UPI001E6F1B32|nr:pilus assembly protein PilP [Delftia tsuruhatensis]CAB5664962.1 Pilus assembly protein, PilP [Delftia tsuruhatensis]CAC9677495.1 Pilus assembly protein, PilP [Delftia tsuruhatensis]